LNRMATASSFLLAKPDSELDALQNRRKAIRAVPFWSETQSFWRLEQKFTGN
jgi:hypothetical protein